MAILFVIYPGDSATRFDREYYVNTHLPLVMEAWGRYGLETAAAFFPTYGGAGMIALCICRFKDEAAITASLKSPQAEGVMDDIPHFTDAVPSQSRAVPL